MPYLKYMLFVGASLIALLVAVDYAVKPAVSATSDSPSSKSSSLELLRKMANHGEARPFAAAATAGTFLPVPPRAPAPAIAAAEPATPAQKPVIAAPPPAALNAQARVAESDVSDKPVRAVKRPVARKPQPSRPAYVENVPRGPNGFFGAFQSW